MVWARSCSSVLEHSQVLCHYDRREAFFKGISEVEEISVMGGIILLSHKSLLHHSAHIAYLGRQKRREKVFSRLTSMRTSEASPISRLLRNRGPSRGTTRSHLQSIPTPSFCEHVESVHHLTWPPRQQDRHTRRMLATDGNDWPHSRQNGTEAHVLQGWTFASSSLEVSGPITGTVASSPIPAGGPWPWIYWASLLLHDENTHHPAAARRLCPGCLWG